MNFIKVKIAHVTYLFCWFSVFPAVVNMTFAVVGFYNASKLQQKRLINQRRRQQGSHEPTNRRKFFLPDQKP